MGPFCLPAWWRITIWSICGISMIAPFAGRTQLDRKTLASLLSPCLFFLHWPFLCFLLHTLLSYHSLCLSMHSWRKSRLVTPDLKCSILSPSSKTTCSKINSPHSSSKKKNSIISLAFLKQILHSAHRTILLYWCVRHHLCCPWSMTWTWGRRAVWFTSWFGGRLLTERQTRGSRILPWASKFHIYKIQMKVISPQSLSIWPFIYVLFCRRQIENTKEHYRKRRDGWWVIPYIAILRSWSAYLFDLGGSGWTSGGSCPFSAWWFESENLK